MTPNTSNVTPLRLALPRRNLVPFVQLHLFIFVLLVSAGISVALQPHRFAGSMDLLSMTAMSVIMYLSLYYLNYSQQPSSEARALCPVGRGGSS